MSVSHLVGPTEPKILRLVKMLIKRHPKSVTYKKFVHTNIDMDKHQFRVRLKLSN